MATGKQALPHPYWHRFLDEKGITSGYSMLDRLKAVESPSEIIDQIGRWQTDHMGQSYGSG